MEKTLIEFIKKIGDEDAALLFEIKPRTAKAYRLSQRFPSRVTAQRIIKKTRRHKLGRITLNGIYTCK